MKNVFIPLGVALTALLLMASPAAAQNVCSNTEATPLTGPHGGITVQSGGVCYLADATIAGNVTVETGGFLQTDRTTISGTVTGRTGAQTVFINDASLVGGSVNTSGTAEVFLFNSTVAGDVFVKRSKAVAQVCGMTVRGELEVKDGQGDVLVGSNDQSTGCNGNLVLRGDLEVKRNNTDVELFVQSNTLLDGDLEVSDNRGTSEKAAQDNTGMGNESIICTGNTAGVTPTGSPSPFVGSPNSGFGIDTGQCESSPASPPVVNFTCNGTFSGITVDNVTVPADGACTLSNSTVAGRVSVRSRAYFEANNKTTIAGSVTASGAQTVFIDQSSIVASDIVTTGTAQVFLFNSTALRDVELRETRTVAETPPVVNVCGMTIRDGLDVKDGNRDVLVGSNDPLTDCAGNLILRGDVEVKRNNVDEELVVQSNTLLDGDLEVNSNRGDAPKMVQDNTGQHDEALVCLDNSAEFTGTPNSGFGSTAGQCSL